MTDLTTIPASFVGPIEAGRERPSGEEREAVAWRKAKEFESVFLAQMLDIAGLSKPPKSFSGGPGEDMFSSFLNREYARLLTEHGEIGIAEQVFQALIEGEGTDEL